ncbi:MAG: hypothetical protein AB2A00_02275 [Myxococcota bacterium]
MLPMASSVDIERTRLITILTTVALAVTGVILFSGWSGSDGRTAAWIGTLNNTILITHTLRHRDGVMARLLLFGVIVGFVELAADAWLVDVTRSLDYSVSNSTMVWRSPWWMIMAWQIVAMQFAYIGLRLYERMGVKGLVLSGLLGAVNIPFYEEMALRLNWWRYRGCAMLSHTPYYIILGELLLVMGFGALARTVRQTSWVNVALAGVAAGVGIFVSYFAAWYVVEAITR